MTKLKWQEYEPKILTRINANTYALRLAKTVSDLEPTCTKIYWDRLLVINGYYNRRGYCVGYSLNFVGSPSILASDFYIILDYVAKGKKPNNPTFPKQKKKKKDSKICLVKFGDLLENRMYAFIYRKKRDD